jgi:hypothetical protein
MGELKEVTKGENSIEKGDEYKFTESFMGAASGIIVMAVPYPINPEYEGEESIESSQAGIALKYRGRNGEMDLGADKVFKLLDNGTLVEYTGTSQMHE